MKAIINLKTIAELPCTISHETPSEVNFEITRDYATATILNILHKMGGVRVFIYDTYVSVYVKTSLVESLVYVD